MTSRTTLAASGALLMLILTACGSQRMTTTFYDFRFGDDNAGWFEISEAPGELSMNATFVMEGEAYENPFALRHADGRSLAYRVGDGEWIELDHPADVHPTSAYPILVPQVAEGGTLRYRALNEGRGEIIGETLLSRDGDVVTETRDGKVVRVFTFDEDGIVRIDWGGPVSTRRASLAEAKAGSPLESAGRNTLGR